MGRKASEKRSAPIEFNPEPPKPEPEPNQNPKPEPVKEGDASESPPKLETAPIAPGAVERPTVTPEATVATDGSSDVRESTGGSESLSDAQTAGREGEGITEPLSREQHEANIRILSVKGDTAPTQPSAPIGEQLIPRKVELGPKRYTVQSSMIGVYQSGATVDQESLGVDDARIEALVKAGVLLPA